MMARRTNDILYLPDRHLVDPTDEQYLEARRVWRETLRPADVRSMARDFMLGMKDEANTDAVIEYQRRWPNGKMEALLDSLDDDGIQKRGRIAGEGSTPNHAPDASQANDELPDPLPEAVDARSIDELARIA